MANQFLEFDRVDNPGNPVLFEPHILPVGRSTRTRAASVYEWTPIDLTNPGSAEALGVGPLQWRISGPVILGSAKNPRGLSPEGLKRWAIIEQWVGQDLVVNIGSFSYGVWIIKDVNMDGDVLFAIPEGERGPGGQLLTVENWWSAFVRHQWRINMVQKTPPDENPDRPALYGGQIAVVALTEPGVESPVDPVVDPGLDLGI